MSTAWPGVEFAEAETSRSVPEHSARGTAVGAPVAVSGGLPASYTLSGPDARFFAIDATTGQIRTVAGVDYDFDARPAYFVTVTATAIVNQSYDYEVSQPLLSDPNTNETQTITFNAVAGGRPAVADVRINIEDTPTVTIGARQARVLMADGRVGFTLASAPAPTADLDVQVAVTSQDHAWFADRNSTGSYDADEDEWGAAFFEFDQGGTNSPVRSGNVTATVQAGTGYEVGSPASATVAVVAAEPAVTVRATQATVTVVERTLSAAVTFRAETVVDAPPLAEDIYVSWETTEDSATAPQDYNAVATEDLVFRIGEFSVVGNRRVAQKTVAIVLVDDGVGEVRERLYATLSRHADTNRLVGLANADGTPCTTASNCGAEIIIVDDDNASPVFTGPFVRTVPENSAAGTRVGAPVTATDDGVTALTYSLGGTDAASFAINATSGQITTIANVGYDFESKPNYAVTVVADDGNATDTAAVAINLTDVVGEGPTLESAEISGTTLTLTFSEDLDPNSVPSTDRFTVTRDGTATAVTQVALQDATATLTLAETAVNLEEVVVAYVPPTTGGLQNASNERVEAFTATAENATPDVRAPVLSRALADGTRIVLVYDEVLDEGSVPASRAYRVTVAGSSASIGDVAIQGVEVRLTLDQAVTPGQSVQLSYTPPSSNPVQDDAGNTAARLDRMSVDNLTASADFGNVRLVGGRDLFEGRLEVLARRAGGTLFGFPEGPLEWGTVCEDRFVEPHDNGLPNIAAGVACRKMGFADGEYVAGYGQPNVSDRGPADPAGRSALLQPTREPLRKRPDAPFPRLLVCWRGVAQLHPRGGRRRALRGRARRPGAGVHQRPGVPVADRNDVPGGSRRFKPAPGHRLRVQSRRVRPQRDAARGGRRVDGCGRVGRRGHRRRDDGAGELRRPEHGRRCQGPAGRGRHRRGGLLRRVHLGRQWHNRPLRAVHESGESTPTEPPLADSGPPASYGETFAVAPFGVIGPMAQLRDVPAEHDGRTPFTASVAFSEEVANVHGAWLGDSLARASNATVEPGPTHGRFVQCWLAPGGDACIPDGGRRAVAGAGADVAGRSPAPHRSVGDRTRPGARGGAGRRRHVDAGVGGAAGRLRDAVGYGLVGTRQRRAAGGGVGARGGPTGAAGAVHAGGRDGRRDGGLRGLGDAPAGGRRRAGTLRAVGRRCGGQRHRDARCRGGRGRPHRHAARGSVRGGSGRRRCP